MQTIVNPEKLWITANFQSTEQTRYYLCGVFIEPADEGVTMTATDGHRLVTCHDPQFFWKLATPRRRAPFLARPTVWYRV